MQNHKLNVKNLPQPEKGDNLVEDNSAQQLSSFAVQIAIHNTESFIVTEINSIRLVGADKPLHL